MEKDIFTLKNVCGIYAIELGGSDIEFINNLKGAINQGVQEGFKKAHNEICDGAVILTKRAFSRTLRNTNQHIDVDVEIILRLEHFCNLDYNVRLHTNYGDYSLDDYEDSDDIIKELLAQFKTSNVYGRNMGMQTINYKLFIMQLISDAEQLGEGTCASICDAEYRAIGTISDNVRYHKIIR